MYLLNYEIVLKVYLNKEHLYIKLTERYQGTNMPTAIQGVINKLSEMTELFCFYYN